MTLKDLGLNYSTKIFCCLNEKKRHITKNISADVKIDYRVFK